MVSLTNINLTTENLVDQVINAATERYVVKNNKMVNEITKMINENEHFYLCIVKQLTINEIQCVLTQCFVDGTINWGRIIAVLTILYVHARKNKDCDVCLRTLKCVFTKFLLKKVSPWIRKHNYVYPCNHSLIRLILYAMIGWYLVSMVTKFVK